MLTVRGTMTSSNAASHRSATQLGDRHMLRFAETQAPNPAALVRSAAFCPEVENHHRGARLAPLLSRQHRHLDQARASYLFPRPNQKRITLESDSSPNRELTLCLCIFQHELTLQHQRQTHSCARVLDMCALTSALSIVSCFLRGNTSASSGGAA